MNKGVLAVYWIAGFILCISGALMMILGVFKGSLPAQVSGVIMYAGSMPLLFQVSFSKLEKRIKDMEERK